MGSTSWETAGSEARSKHSETLRRRLWASSMLLKKVVCSATPLMPKVLFTLPTAAISTPQTVYLHALYLDGHMKNRYLPLDAHSPPLQSHHKQFICMHYT